MSSMVNRISKKFFAYVLAFMLVVCMLPMATPLSVNAAVQPSFTVSIGSEIKGDIKAALVNTLDPNDSARADFVDGIATFNNFYDDEKTYDLTILGMIGYEDFTDTLEPGRGDVSYQADDFEQLVKITISGTILDDEGIVYTGGGTIEYSGYTSGSLEVLENGTFTFEAYASQEYNFVFNPTDPKYKNLEFNVNSAVDYEITTDNRLKLNTYSVGISYDDTLGTVTPNQADLTSVEHGSQVKLTIEAKDGYQIDMVTNNDNEVAGDATDKTSYDYEFIVTEDSAIDISFVPVEPVKNTYAIDISSSENGKIYIGDRETSNPELVEHGGELELRILPNADYYVSDIKVDGNSLEVNDANITMNDDYSLTYTFSNVTKGYTIGVEFSAIDLTEYANSNLFSSEATSEIIPSETIDGKEILMYKNGTTVTFKPANTYVAIGYNGQQVSAGSFEINETTTITKITVWENWKNVFTKQLDTPIMIAIDNTKPVLDDIDDMEWSNDSNTVTGTVIDANEGNNPSSGLNSVVWSEEALSDEEVLATLASGTSTSVIKDGGYTFSISDEKINVPYYVYAVDNADNVSGAETVTIKVDKTEPTITGFNFEKTNTEQTLHLLDYGTFSNSDIKLTVIAHDNGIDDEKPGSGVESITLYCDGNEIAKETATFDTEGVFSAVFTLTGEDFYGGTISAVATDKAANESAQRSPMDEEISEDATNAKSDIVSIKLEKPSIQIVPTSPADYVNGQQNWYDGNVEFDVAIETESGGINSVKITVNDIEITEDLEGNQVNAKFFETETGSLSFLIDTALGGKNELGFIRGKNTIEIVATNNYGNVTSVTETVYIDVDNPTITQFEIQKLNGDALHKVLNFLTFGNFFNEQVQVVVTTDDAYDATSGIDKVILYIKDKDGNVLQTLEQVAKSPDEDVSSPYYQAVFILPEELRFEELLFDAELSALAVDNVGNITGEDAENPDGVPVGAKTVNADLGSDRLVIETVSPVITINMPEDVYTGDDGKNWYANDVLFDIETQDEHAGIRTVQATINNVVVYDYAYERPENETVDTVVWSRSFSVNTNAVEKNIFDGSYELEVIVTDNAGNTYVQNRVVYIDRVAPVIVGYDFEPQTYDGISNTTYFVENLEYAMYFRTDFNVTINIDDEIPSSGLSTAEIRIINSLNGETETLTREIVDEKVEIVIPQGFKGQIFAKAVDNVGYVSSERTSQGLVSETELPTINVINNTETGISDAEGNKLYTTDMSFTVVVSDYVSGIREIGFSQSAEVVSIGRIPTLFENTGYSVGSIVGEWRIEEMDANLVTKVSRTITLQADDNDVMLNFDATDRSGNILNGVQSEAVTIDKTAPEMSVAFGADDDADEYYDANRVATITVTERNFSPELIIADIENTYGSVPTFTFTSNSNEEHVAMIDFDEGDYTFGMSGADRGGHAATVTFSGGNEHLFYVDKTAPTVDTNFASFVNSATENSFNSNQMVTISIDEHNFDADLVQLNVMRKAAGENHDASGLADISQSFTRLSDWGEAGDIHTLSFELNLDAVYQISMTLSDLAGNAGERQSTIVFEIDKTAPVVARKNNVPVNPNDTTLLDVYTFDRKDAPLPSVEFEDLNIDHIEYNLVVYSPDYSSTEADIIIAPETKYLNEDSAQMGEVSGNAVALPEFEDDGVYALELVAVDVAGNRSELNSNTYARMVQQDVLAYVLNSNLEAKTGIYSIQY